MTLSFSVLGRPLPAGSKRAFAVRKAGRPTGAINVRADNPDQYAWQDAVRGAAHRAITNGAAGADLLDGPLRLDVTFYFRRPRHHYGTGRNASKLKPSAPAHPTVKPDLTKLVRALEDGLSGVVIADDARITDHVTRKRYGFPERADVVITQLESEAA